MKSGDSNWDDLQKLKVVFRAIIPMVYILYKNLLYNSTCCQIIRLNSVCSRARVCVYAFASYLLNSSFPNAKLFFLLFICLFHILHIHISPALPLLLLCKEGWNHPHPLFSTWKSRVHAKANTTHAHTLWTLKIALIQLINFIRPIKIIQALYKKKISTHSNEWQGALRSKAGDRQRARELVPFNMGRLFPHFFRRKRMGMEGVGVAVLSFYSHDLYALRFSCHHLCETGELCQVPTEASSFFHSFIHSFIFCVCQSVSQWVSLPVDKCILHTIPLTLCQISTTHTPHTHTAHTAHTPESVFVLHISVLLK